MSDYRLADSFATTKQGVLKGRREKNGITAFLGIPYAMPPVGKLRFCPPSDPQSWVSVRNATRFGGESLQIIDDTDLAIPGTKEYKIGVQPSEDCLYLNIWTPAHSETDRLPVFFWIHGGGFRGGAGSRNLYAGDALALKGIIVVTINYRLSVFGFMTHPIIERETEHGCSGNYGLLDQLQALRWVHENIETFGGDPESITLAGQSSGAISVCGHILSPLSNSLFKRVCLQSGGLYSSQIEYQSRENAVSRADAFLRRHDLYSLEQLQDISALELLNYAAEEIWHPCIDGWFLPKPIDELLSENTYQGECLAGCTSDEWLADTPQNSLDEDSLRGFLHTYYAPWEKQLQTHYPFDNVSDHVTMAYIRMSSDSMFTGMLRTVEALYSGKSTYVYYFNHRIQTHIPSLQGAAHGLELPYVFGRTHLGGLAPWEYRKWDQRDQEISMEMMNYWSNFAKTGNPNQDGLPAWPAYTHDQPDILEFSNLTKILKNPDLYRNQLLLRNILADGSSIPAQAPFYKK